MIQYKHQKRSFSLCVEQIVVISVAVEDVDVDVGVAVAVITAPTAPTPQITMVITTAVAAETATHGFARHTPKATTTDTGTDMKQASEMALGPALALWKQLNLHLRMAVDVRETLTPQTPAAALLQTPAAAIPATNRL